MVSTGRVQEFRAATGNAPQLWKVPLPTFAVAYRRRLSRTEYDYRLMLLEDVRREALGAITDAGLEAAGYSGANALARFRRDWVIDEKKRFEPLRSVFVYRVRPIEPGDHEAVGLALVRHLYGQHYEEAQACPRTLSTFERADQSTRRIAPAVAGGGR
jgi:hypothetical protein